MAHITQPLPPNDPRNVTPAAADPQPHCRPTHGQYSADHYLPATVLQTQRCAHAKESAAATAAAMDLEGGGLSLDGVDGYFARGPQTLVGREGSIDVWTLNADRTGPPGEG